MGGFKTIIDYHERILEIARELGDRWNEGAAYGNLGNAYQSLGDFKRAIDYHKRCLELQKNWATDQDKERRVEILVTPIAVWEISKQP